SVVGSLHAGGVRGQLDTPLDGARLFPEKTDEEKSFGAEPGGGVRVVVAGMRVLAQSNGGIATSADRLPAAPAQVIALPSRLGDGFLFQIGTTIWRSDRWLGPVVPIFVSPVAISR